MKNFVLLAVCLMIPLLGISQLCLDTSEVRIVNRVFLERDLYKERTIELSLSLDTLQAKCAQTVKAKNSALQEAKSLMALYEEVTYNDSIMFANYEKMQKKETLKLKYTKLQRNVLFLGVAALVIKFVL